MKLYKNSIFILMLAFSMLVSSPAQSDDMLLEDGGSWLQIVGEGSLKFIDPRLENGRIWLEGQSRFDDDWKHWYQGMVRTALGYSLSDRATIWLGYTWLPTQNIGKAYNSQQDIWPAFRYILPTDYGTFMFRTMVEANFLRGNGDDVRFRPRQMVRFMYPFDFEPRLNLVLWDEFFVKANTTLSGGKSGFDQNRAFGGLAWMFNKNVRFEAGYLNQYLENPLHVGTNTMHHLIMGSLFINF